MVQWFSACHTSVRTSAQICGTHTKSQALCCAPGFLVLERPRLGIPEVSWPPGLAKSVSYRFSERLSQNKMKHNSHHKNPQSTEF